MCDMSYDIAEDSSQKIINAKYLECLIGLLGEHACLDFDDDENPWMKKSVDPPPQTCALNPPDVAQRINSHQNGQPRDDCRPPVKTEGNAGFRFRRQKRDQPFPPQRMNHSWFTPTYDNSTADWLTPTIKNEPSPVHYKMASRPAYYPQSGGDWADTAACNVQPPNYGMLQQANNSVAHGPSINYDYNGMYNNNNNAYNNNYAQPSYYPPNYGQQNQAYQGIPQPQPRMDGYSRNMAPAPMVKPSSDPEFPRKQEYTELLPRAQIKKEQRQHQALMEPEGDNFTSIFTKSILSLDAQAPENNFPDTNSDGNQHHIPPPPPFQPPPVMQNVEDQPMSLQRLHTSGGHYTAGDYGSNNYSFFDNKNYGSGGTIHEIGIKVEGANSFRYDRPSFDDFGLYAPNPPAPKPLTIHKRKNNLSNMPPENHSTEGRKKAPRTATPYQSESQWTPNSFDFGAVAIKQEPLDEYNSNEYDTQMSYKDSSPSSSGRSSQVKTPEQTKEPKPPPRKRSPGRTCFDRFDKKSTPTSKKVSPLSVYAKVQDSMVLNVKCRRYKKRTKPITIKEEPVSPNREEMENFKRENLTPDQAARRVVSDLVERVSLYGERNIVGDLEHMDPNQLRERLMQFCHRSNIDYRDFDDARSILVPRIVNDTKNSERASAIRRRTSPAEAEVVKTRRRGRRKVDLENQPVVETRVLRQLPGRSTRGRPYCSQNEKVRTTVDLTGDVEVDSVTVIEVDQADVIEVMEIVEDVSEMRECIDLTIEFPKITDTEAEVQKIPNGKEESEMIDESSEPEEVSIDEQATVKEREEEEAEQVEKNTEKSEEQAATKEEEVTSELDMVDKIQAKTKKEATKKVTEKIKEKATPEKVSKSPEKTKKQATAKAAEKDEDKKGKPEKVDKNMAKATGKHEDKKGKPEMVDKNMAKAAGKDEDKKGKPEMVENMAKAAGKHEDKKGKPEMVDKNMAKVAGKDEDKKGKPEMVENMAKAAGKEEDKNGKPEMADKNMAKAKKQATAKGAEKVEEKPKTERVNKRKKQATAETDEEKCNKQATAEKEEDKPKVVARRRGREVSLEDVTNLVENETTEEPEDNRRRTRSSSRKVKVEDELPAPPPRKRRSCVRPVCSSVFDPEVEIVDVRPRSASPPVLTQVKPKPARKPRAKRGRRRRYTKSKKVNKESSILEPNPILVEEEEPPVLQKSGTKAKKGGAAKMEPPLLKSEVPVKGKKRKSSHETPEKIKVEPFSSFQDEKIGKENTSSYVDTAKPKIDDRSPVLSSVNNSAKDNADPISTNSAVKSGSSKRKQGGPTKYLKENSITVIPHSFILSNAEENVISVKTFCNSKLLSNFNPAKFLKLEAAPVIVPASENSPASLRERYLKSFCSETPSLPNTFKKPTESGKKSLSSSQKSQNHRFGNKSVHFSEQSTGATTKINNSNKAFYNLNKKAQKAVPSVVAKVKEEPLSDDDIPEASIQVAATKKANSDIRSGKKRAKSAAKANGDIKNGKKPPKCSSKTNCDIKKGNKPSKSTAGVIKTEHQSVSRRRSSQCSDGDPRVVITRLPDGQLEDEVVLKREKDTSKGDEDSEYDSDEEKPLFYFIQKQREKEEQRSLKLDTSLPKLPEEDHNTPKTVHTRRYSDSEDSDCGLVIDLDRRMSVEEQDPSPEKDTKENETLPTVNEINDETNDVSEPTRMETDDTTATETATAVPATFYHDATEEAHILLELSRSGVQSFAPEAPEPWQPSVVTAETSLVESGSTEGGQSILRTLLLENGDQVPLQDSEPSSSPSKDSVLDQETEEALLHQANSFSVAGKEDGCLFDPTQFTSDQLPTELNGNVLLEESPEWMSWGLQEIRAEIRKVKNEIRGLDKMADGKDQERASIICYKKYKEEVLRRLLENYSAKLQKQAKGKQHSNKTKNSANATNSEAIYPTTFRTGSPSATVTSSDSLESNPGENLPTVATMVANATDNYGVDLRTVTTRQENLGATSTILHEALSSNELIYRPVAIRSPLPPMDRPAEGSQMIHKKSLATQECSFVPHMHSEAPIRSPKTPRSRRFFWSESSNNNFGQSSSSFAAVGPAETLKCVPSSASYNGASSRRPSPIATPNHHWSTSKVDFDPNTIDLRNNPMSPTRRTHSRTSSYSSNGSGYTNDHSPFRSVPVRPTNSNSSEIPFAMGSSNGNLFKRSASYKLSNGLASETGFMNGHSSDRSASFRLPNGNASGSGMTNGQFSNGSFLTNGQPSFMVVPPPTTLPSSFGSYAAMSAAHPEWHLDIKVEDTHENGEDPLFFGVNYEPYAGLLMTIPPSVDHSPTRCKGCGNDSPSFVCCGCKLHWYCGRECQNLRWAEHARTCLRADLKESTKSYK